ncbi:MAG: hypothetical protein KF773_35240 [Deltaproteobacteria bacterium]|nr:hypothetical protein [Deltaproteobacteria bacterium]MCW5805312.1 hypothetical protein [Deltaproteobacteria bacterium]
MRNVGIIVALTLAAVGCGKARNLGKQCNNSDDCGSLTCGWELKKEGVPSEIVSVCTMACKSNDDCKVELGDSQCTEGVCVRECRQDADCPAQTYCINRHHCGR